MQLHVPPPFRVVAERFPPELRVDVLAAHEVAAQSVEEVLSVDLATELLALLRPTRNLAPPRQVLAVRSLVNACHRPSSLRAVRVAATPDEAQTGPRSA